VNALELAGRAAELERDYELANLPGLRDVGALPGTRAYARLRFALFDRHPTIEADVSGVVVLTCQRCLKPCACTLDETALLIVVARESEEIGSGYEPWIGDPERLPVGAVIQEQVLLALPLVPMHADTDDCRARAGEGPQDAGREDRQRPFAKLRELLDKDR
jgi:uncharacterized protein